MRLNSARECGSEDSSANSVNKDTKKFSMDSAVPLPIPEEQLEDLVEKAKDFALMHGICMRRRGPQGHFDRDALHFAPFVLFPSPFPREVFHKVVELQPVLNELTHKVAHDYEFLKESLKYTIQVDNFTGKLFEIYEKVHKEGAVQDLSLGMIRSDVMLNRHCCPKSDCCSQGMSFCCCSQVELNTIASGFGWLGPASSLLQRYVVAEAGHEELLDDMPENLALEGLAGALVEAWRIYARPKSVVMFLVEDVTYNICDQKFHKFEMRRQCPEVFVIRKTLSDLAARAHLTEDKRLVVDGHEVGVVYMRCGYHPDQYPTEAEWGARLMMERSRAIKSPSIHYHLAGTKKVQQELANPGVLEKFLGDEAKVEAVRDIFTGLYPIGEKSVEDAMANPEKYVLKPQREGGGNNVYGEDIKDVLAKMGDSEERNAYILMDRIGPPVSRNYMVRPGGGTELVEVVSELGIFGYVIGTKDKILANKYVGHMLRTKKSHVNEGGVAAGLGALDSVLLVDTTKCCNK